MVERSKLTDCRNANGVIIGVTPEKKKVLMVPDTKLLTLLLELDGDNKVTAYDIEEKSTGEYRSWFDYGLRLTEPGWLEIDGEKLGAGETITIQLADDQPSVYLSKDSLPLKLKKAEFTGLSYRVFPAEKVVGIRKRFENLSDHGFELIQLYQII